MSKAIRDCHKCVHCWCCEDEINPYDCKNYETHIGEHLIEKMLKETYFEVANYDVSKLPESDSYKLSVIAGEFRRIMVNKLRDY